MEPLTSPNNMTEFLLLGLTQNPQLQKILCCPFAHVPIHCARQPAHRHHHLPQPHIFSSHVLLSQSFVLHRCHLHLCHHAQTDHWPAAPEENHLLGWLSESALYGALPGRIRDHCPHCYGLWPLCGIWKPLHYTTIMWQGICQLLVVVAWTGASGMPPCRFFSQ